MKPPGVVLVVVAVLGCTGESSNRAELLVRDSAGIAIVENAGPAWPEEEGWRVDASPMLQLGQVDGDEAHIFSNVAGAVRLSDGSIVVADAGSSQLRFFDASGVHIRSIGGSGAGPGTFRVIAAMIAMPGDSLLVVDPANRRISVAHVSGAIREIRVPDAVMMLHPLRPPGDGSLIGYGSTSQLQATAGRDTLDVIEIMLDGDGSQRIARLPGESREYARGFGPTPVITGAVDGFWYGSGDTYEIGRYDRRGNLLRIMRMPHNPVPVPAEMIAQYEKHEAEASARFGAVPTRRAFPQHLPPYAGALSDSEGNLWVRPFGTGERATWNVSNAEGHYLGDVELPDGIIPFEIGADYVLSPAWDEFRVQYVRLYRLTKR